MIKFKTLLQPRYIFENIKCSSFFQVIYFVTHLPLPLQQFVIQKLRISVIRAWVFRSFVIHSCLGISCFVIPFSPQSIRLRQRLRRDMQSTVLSFALSLKSLKSPTSPLGISVIRHSFVLGYFGHSSLFPRQQAPHHLIPFRRWMWCPTIRTLFI